MFSKKEFLVIYFTQRLEEKMKYESQGFLQIGAYTAGGALPTPNITVKITGSDEENGGINYSILTDRNGLTDTIALPTPSASYSLAPGSPEQPYAKYNVEASGTGFYPKSIYDVIVFGGVKSILPLEMIPDGGIQRNVNSPSSSNSSIITENEDLQ